jgi:hypothetical protein
MKFKKQSRRFGDKVKKEKEKNRFIVARFFHSFGAYQIFVLSTKLEISSFVNHLTNS